jgi:toxin ParE1/3/4
MKRLVIAPSAAADLNDIFDYIVRDRPAAAVGLIERLEAASRLLAEHPGMGRSRPELGLGIRTYAVERYLIVYRDATDHVLVIRYYHGARQPDRMV